MTRYDPFESMERMFEQMRRSTFGGPGFGRRGDGRTHALDAGWDADLATQDADRPAPWMDTSARPRVGPTGTSTGRGTTGSGVRLEPTDDGYVAVADLPGFEREDITVRLEDHFLTIEAAHEESAEDESASWRGTRRVQETVQVPGGTDLLTDDVEATYRNGVLEVTIPTAGDEADDEHVIDVE